MAGVAGHTVVRISANIWVTEIVCIIAAMAAGALESGISCRGTRMASCAYSPCIAVIDGEETVGEFRAQPIRCRMASSAGSRGDAHGSSILRKMIRHQSTQRQRAVPISRVATVAICRGHRI